VAVNVSADQLGRDGFVEDVRQALRASGLSPSALTLEITETALTRDVAAASERLRAVRELGVRTAIDDFGTGFSSLAYLRQFAPDALKIDRSFVAGLTTSKDSAAIVHTLVALGRTLHIKTLAEGIETPEQLEVLRRERCEWGQGFLFAEPLTAEELERQASAPTFSGSVSGASSSVGAGGR
jgi:EAL domain-containing protein (putative c-di-GMP-specific phosphodiesterase class I)